MQSSAPSPNLSRVLASVLCAGALLTATQAAAQDAEWEYRVTLYMLGAAQSGTTTIRGIEQDIDLSFSDIWGNLEFGGMLHFRAHNERWLAQADAIYMQLRSEVDRPPLTADFDQTAIELIGGYRASQEIELLFGMRFNRIGGGIVGNVAGRLDVDGSEDWIDPLVGAAWTRQLGQRWMLRLRGDIGGFGVGSDFAWQALGLVGWDFADRWSLLLGYRHLAMDYATGSGRDLFAYDVATSGPQVGVSFRF
jgi:hypothetical protein